MSLLLLSLSLFPCIYGVPSPPCNFSKVDEGYHGIWLFPVRNSGTHGKELRFGLWLRNESGVGILHASVHRKQVHYMGLSSFCIALCYVWPKPEKISGEEDSPPN